MVFDLIKKARSYRSFDESVVIDENQLKSFVDGARYSSSAINLQPLRYKLVYEKNEVEAVLSNTKWGGMLPDLKLPPDGHHPTSFIIVCKDKSVKNISYSDIDLGIAAESIMLQAVEKGYGGCFIAAFSKNEISQMFSFEETIEPVLIIALGKPDETVVIKEIGKNESTKYFRTDDNLHVVPKIQLSDILL